MSSRLSFSRLNEFSPGRLGLRLAYEEAGSLGGKLGGKLERLSCCSLGIWLSGSGEDGMAGEVGKEGCKL